jgi:tetratricopeptide (TPR) repeat protein
MLKLILVVTTLLLVLSGCGSSKLVIESDPAGGEVYIDDKLMGKTPLTVAYNTLPYEDNLTLRIEKHDFSALIAVVQGPRQAGIGEKVHLKLSKAPDEVAKLNAQLDRVMQAHKLAMDRHYIESERIIDQMLAEFPELIAPRLLKGAVFMMAKNYDKAQAEYQEVLGLDPANVEATKMLTYLQTRANGAKAVEVKPADGQEKKQ